MASAAEALLTEISTLSEAIGAMLTEACLEASGCLFPMSELPRNPLSFNTSNIAPKLPWHPNAPDSIGFRKICGDARSNNAAKARGAFPSHVGAILFLDLPYDMLIVIFCTAQNPSRIVDPISPGYHSTPKTSCGRVTAGGATILLQSPLNAMCVFFFASFSRPKHL